MRVDDVVALMRAHRQRDDEKFRAIAMAIAANERGDRPSGEKLFAAAKALDDRPAELPPKVAGMVRAPVDGGAPVLTADLKGRVDRIVDEHKAGDTIKSAGLRPVGSVMFVGPPGVGKTMTAGWIGSQIGLPTYVVRTEALISSLLGESSANIGALFDEIDLRPGVWVFDELDSLGASRGVESRDVGEMSRVTNTLLRCMDQVQGSHRGLICASTNAPDTLDGALIDRFDEVLQFDPPGDDCMIDELIASVVGAIKVDFTPPEAAAYREHNHRQIVRDLHRLAKEHLLAGEVA
jgi:hypothetical protein